MTAAAVRSEPTSSTPAKSAPSTASDVEVSGPSFRDDPEAREVARARAEHAVLHGGIVGAIIGVLVLAPTWAGLVLLALRSSGTALAPPALMAAGVGVIAGVFMGGWAGTLFGSTALEHFEHETRPEAPPQSS